MNHLFNLLYEPNEALNEVEVEMKLILTLTLNTDQIQDTLTQQFYAI